MLRRAMAFASVAAFAGALAACDGADKGTSISFTGNVADGNSVSMDGETGQVKVDVPGFEGAFKLPKVQLTADNFDLNGVKLYPGSKISGFRVDARGKDDGQVHVAFDSPATAETVRDWFEQRLPRAGYTVRPEGDGLAGSTDENQPFELKLDDAPEGKAKGTIVIG